MKITTFFKNTLLALYKSLQRFPIPIALSTSVVIMLMTIYETQIKSGYNNPNIDILNRVTMVLVLGFLLSLCIKLLFERYTDTPKNLKPFIYIIATTMLVLYYFFLLKDFSMVSVSRFLALCFALLLCFLFIPYLGQRKNLELYTIKIFTRFFITIIYTMVLFLGLSAIIFTLDRLLGVPINSKLYYYTWILTAGIFAPIFLLAGIPASNENLEVYEYPKFFKILILYIIMPLITIYITILYIYFAKIIITKTWPIGLVSHLVLWYSALCVVIIFMISPIKNNIWIDKFTFFFPKFIIPILLMMFTSMGIRIKAYGITENRYYVIILGIWILCIMLYFNFKKSRNHLIVLASLALISIVSTFGPLSSFNMSKLSQNRRLTNILSKNEMITGKQIMPKSDIPVEDQDEISRILAYFKNTHSLQDIKYLNDTFILADMSNTFGFAYRDYKTSLSDEQYFSYYVDKDSGPTEIAGYDFMFNFKDMLRSVSVDDLLIDYNAGDGNINIFLDEKEIYHLDLADFLESLHTQYPNQHSISQEDMTITDENEFIEVKFMFSHINGSKNNIDDTFKVHGGQLQFHLFYKVK